MQEPRVYRPISILGISSTGISSISLTFVHFNSHLNLLVSCSPPMFQSFDAARNFYPFPYPYVCSNMGG